MSGQELKEVLINKGWLLKDVAAKLGLTQPNFSQIVKAQDVKSGTLENICDALGVKMDFFYEGTRFAPQVVSEQLQPSKDLEDYNKEVLYLQGQLNAMKEAYKTLLESISNSSSNNFKRVANE